MAPPQQYVHAVHIKDTSGAPSSGDRGDCASGTTGHLLCKATLSRPGEVSELSNIHKHIELGKMRRQRIGHNSKNKTKS